MISTARKEDIIPIPTREVPATKAKAEKGDIDAINKLIGYYLRHDQDAEAQKWGARRDEIHQSGMANKSSNQSLEPTAGRSAQGLKDEWSESG